MSALVFGAVAPCSRCATAGYLTPPKPGDPSTAGEPAAVRDRGRIRELLEQVRGVEFPAALDVVLVGHDADGRAIVGKSAHHYVRCPACGGRGFA